MKDKKLRKPEKILSTLNALSDIAMATEDKKRRKKAKPRGSNLQRKIAKLKKFITRRKQARR